VLGQLIEQQALPSLLPQALSTFQQGIPVCFGLLTLHLGGIEYQGKLLPWQKVQCIYTPSTKRRESQDTLCLLERGDHSSEPRRDWAMVYSSQVPNFALLWRLVSSIAQSPPSVSCIPLVAGRSARITYSGWLAPTSSSLTLHWGYNNWNRIQNAEMMKQHHGIWQATILVPSEASLINMAFFNQSGVWDNKNADNYNLNVLESSCWRPFLGSMREETSSFSTSSCISKSFVS
jgi:hypothetical protein